MAVLLIAEHNNKELRPFTLNAITAASQIDPEVHAVIIGQNSEGAAKALSNLSSVKKAKFRVEEKQLILKDIFSQVQIDTANAWTTYNSSRGVLDATEAQLKAAEIANEGITLEYETGNKRTTLEVIQSRTLLLDARTSYAKAQKDFAIAQFNLLAATGDLYLDNIK